MKCGWYVVQAHPQMERIAVSSIRRLGFTSIFPLLALGSERPSPLFSRYIFSRIEADDESWRAIWRAHGVSRILGGEAPYPVRDGWFEHLFAKLSITDEEDYILRISSASDLLEFIPGEMVRVMSGIYSDSIAECVWSSVNSIVVDLMMGHITDRVRLPTTAVEHYPRRTMEGSVGRILTP